MSRTIASVLTLIMTAFVSLTSYAQPHVVFVTGDDEYRSEITMPVIAQILEKHHGFKCSVAYAVDPDKGERNPKFKTNIEGLEALKTADLMVIYTRFRALPDDQLNMIVDYANSGKPMVGLRTTTHAFLYKEGPNQKWDDGFGAQVFGQKWITHHGHESTTAVSVIEDNKDHPILRGVQQPFHCASWLYHVEPLVGDCDPLLVGKSVNSNKTNQLDKFPLTQAVAWTKSYTGESGDPARVFFTTLGHPSDFNNVEMRKLLVNGIYWSLGMEDKIPAGGAIVDFVEPYDAPPTH